MQNRATRSLANARRPGTSGANPRRASSTPPSSSSRAPPRTTSTTSTPEARALRQITTSDHRQSRTLTTSLVRNSGASERGVCEARRAPRFGNLTVNKS